MRRVLLVVGIIAVVAGAGMAVAQQPGTEPRGAGAPVQSLAVARARAAATTLSTELRARLMKEMAAGGALQAVKMCSEVAQAQA